MVALIRPDMPPDALIEVRRHVSPLVDVGRPVVVDDRVLITDAPIAMWTVEADGSVSRLAPLPDGGAELVRFYRQHEISRVIEMGLMPP